MTVALLVAEVVLAVASVWATAALLAWPESPARLIPGWRKR